MNAEEEVLAKLDRLGALLFARDPAVVGELWCDLGFTLYGSELLWCAMPLSLVLKALSGASTTPSAIALQAIRHGSGGSDGHAGVQIRASGRCERTRFVAIFNTLSR